MHGFFCKLRVSFRSASVICYEVFGPFVGLIILNLIDTIAPTVTANRSHESIKKVHIKLFKKIFATRVRIIIKGTEIIWKTLKPMKSSSLGCHIRSQMVLFLLRSSGFILQDRIIHFVIHNIYDAQSMRFKAADSIYTNLLRIYKLWPRYR
jgi:hypothetical protein